MAIKRAPTSGRGVAHGLAIAVGIPPELAVPAGERAVAAMMALKQARDAGGGALRGHHLHRAQRHIAALDPARHGTLARHLQAHALALQGRGGDTRIAHVTPGEVVVPKRLQNPEFLMALRILAHAHGIDPATLRVGSGRTAVNPRTGQMEFDDDSDDDGDIYGDEGEDIDPGFDAPGFEDSEDNDPGFDGTDENIVENPSANPEDETDNPFTPLYADSDGNPIEGITVTAQRPDIFANPYFQNVKTGIFQGVDQAVGVPGDFLQNDFHTSIPYVPTSADADQWTFSHTPEYVPATPMGQHVQDTVRLLAKNAITLPVGGLLGKGTGALMALGQNFLKNK